MLTDQAKRMIELTEHKRELERELAEIKGELDALGAALVDAFCQAGLTNLTMDGMTLYVHRQAWARPRDGETLRAIRALEQSGFGDYVILGNQKVSALFRGAPEEIEGLPPEVRDAFEVYENVSIKARKAG